MGLAATQARFLGITARKSACEFQSMQVAQQKLGITRDQMRATEQYNAAMRATKLIWESGYDNPLDLSYNLMTHPWIGNDYTPSILTDSTGRVVLNGTLAAAMKTAGFPKGRPIERTTENYQKFIEALGVEQEIPVAMSNAILSLDVDNAKGKLYDNQAGYGKIPAENYENVVNINNIALYVDKVIVASKQQSYLEDEGVQKTAEAFTFNTTANPVSLSAGSSIFVGGVAQSNPSFTLSDVLKGEVAFVTTTGSDADLKKIGDWLLAAFDTLLPEDAYSEDVGAAWFARKQLTEKYMTTTAALTSGSLSTDQATGAFAASSQNVNGWVQMSANSGSIFTRAILEKLDANKQTGFKSGTAGAISVSNLAKAYLTAYQSALDGYSTNVGRYETNSTVKDSYSVADNLDQLFYINNVFISGDNSTDEKSYYYNDFYNMLFNNICANGWTDEYADKVDDKEYLAHALKNGQLFVSGLNTDGYYYQDEYTRNGYIVEVADEDKIAQAEVEYTRAKARLNYKEETMDLEMKNLDMEIAALSSEYDSVKSMIGKNTEKIFNMFQ